MLIRKGNVELNIKEQFLQQYLNQGYDVIDTSGKVIKKGIPNDVISLKAALNEANKEIDKLNTEIFNLRNKIASFENAAKENKKKSSAVKNTK